eukprot:5344284-Prymnesium_polylepis.1
MKQRLRWAMGSLQIFLNDNPLWMDGLTWKQVFPLHPSTLRRESAPQPLRLAPNPRLEAALTRCCGVHPHPLCAGGPAAAAHGRTLIRCGRSPLFAQALLFFASGIQYFMAFPIIVVVCFVPWFMLTKIPPLSAPLNAFSLYFCLNYLLGRLMNFLLNRGGSDLEL